MQIRKFVSTFISHYTKTNHLWYYRINLLLTALHIGFYSWYHSTSSLDDNKGVLMISYFDCACPVLISQRLPNSDPCVCLLLSMFRASLASGLSFLPTFHRQYGYSPLMGSLWFSRNSNVLTSPIFLPFVAVPILAFIYPSNSFDNGLRIPWNYTGGLTAWKPLLKLAKASIRPSFRPQMPLRKSDIRRTEIYSPCSKLFVIHVAMFHGSRKIYAFLK